MIATEPDWRAGGFGVYVHWPFCQAKCPYCDFNSHVVAAVDQPRWRRALIDELGAMRARTGARMVDTVFFGGGTPSLMPAETVGAVIEAIHRLWGAAPSVEITLEANPTSVEAARFADYAAAGVNRLSMGVQSLRDADLKMLGRMHSAAEAIAAFDIARKQFRRVSFDLIYARAGQTLGAWEAELREALALAVDHLSLYQLTIEPDTPFAALHARGKLRTPPDDLAADLYDLTQSLCAAAGMPAYEISNHARPGAESRHNLVYWRYGDYAGAGPGAHGRITTAAARLALATRKDPAAWLDAVGAAGDGLEAVEAVSDHEQAEEMLMMGLRLVEGVSRARFERLAGHTAPADALERLTRDGLVEVSGDRLRATARGRLVLNAVLRDLLA